MARKTKTLGINLPVPQNREEAAATLREIGEINRKVARLEATLNDRLSKLKEAAETEAQPLRDAVEAKLNGLKVWAEANRTTLTGGDKTKTVDLGTGIVKWRKRPPSVTLRKVEDILARLKTMGLQRFIRERQEVDKEAMLKEREVATTVAGVSIGSEGEDFVAEPFEVELAGGAT
jgi:phage host-nuclease inhibitor protein Gam